MKVNIVFKVTPLEAEPVRKECDVPSSKCFGAHHTLTLLRLREKSNLLAGHRFLYRTSENIRQLGFRKFRNKVLRQHKLMECLFGQPLIRGMASNPFLPCLSQLYI